MLIYIFMIIVDLTIDIIFMHQSIGIPLNINVACILSILYLNQWNIIITYVFSIKYQHSFCYVSGYNTYVLHGFINSWIAEEILVKYSTLNSWQ